MSNAGPKAMLTTTEAATRLGVSRQTVLRWVRGHTLPAVRVGRQWRVEGRALATWIDARRNACQVPQTNGQPS